MPKSVRPIIVLYLIILKNSAGVKRTSCDEKQVKKQRMQGWLKKPFLLIHKVHMCTQRRSLYAR